MIKIFLDSSDMGKIKEFEPRVQGFTTNPTLMRKAGVTDYEKFCKEVLSIVNGKPVSFEVFADDFHEMERQAKIISSWGDNVYVKVPITNTKGESSQALINRLSGDGLKINVTAVTDWNQCLEIIPEAPMIISVFAGRIADTGVSPMGFFWRKARRANSSYQSENLWASPREVLNIYQAEEAGANIITCTPELIDKYEKFRGMDLHELSLETVKMFFRDGQAAGFKL